MLQVAVITFNQLKRTGESPKQERQTSERGFSRKRQFMPGISDTQVKGISYVTEFGTVKNKMFKISARRGAVRTRTRTSTFEGWTMVLGN